MNNRRHKIGVFGIGAIGSVIAFELQNSNSSNDFHFYNRSPKRGIRILRDGSRVEMPIALEKLPYGEKNLDWLIVCIKEYQYNDAIESLSGLIDPTTKVAVIRNGLRLKEPILKFTSETNILECSIDCPVQPMEDDFYALLKNPVISIPKGALADQFAQLFEGGSMEIDKVHDFKTESWKKLCESSALGSILCLSGESCWIFEDEKLRKLYSDILKEGIEVAMADGATIEGNFADQMMSKLLSYPKTKGSSMLTDRRNRNPIELGAKNQAITRVGEQYGIRTPLNDAIVELLANVHAFESGQNLFELNSGLLKEYL